MQRVLIAEDERPARAETSHAPPSSPQGGTRAVKAAHGPRLMLALVAVTLVSMDLFVARPGAPGAGDDEVLSGVTGSEAGSYLVSRR